MGPAHGTVGDKRGGMMDRLELLRSAVGALLNSGEVDGVLALKGGLPASRPHLYRPGDDLGDLVLWPKYAIPKTMDLLLEADAEVRLGMVTRGCEVWWAAKVPC